MDANGLMLIWAESNDFGLHEHPVGRYLECHWCPKATIYIKIYGHSAGLPLFLMDEGVTFSKDLFFFFNLQYAHLLYIDKWKDKTGSNTSDCLEWSEYSFLSSTQQIFTEWSLCISLPRALGLQEGAKQIEVLILVEFVGMLYSVFVFWWT